MSTSTATAVEAGTTEVRTVGPGSATDPVRLLPVHDIDSESASWESIAVNAETDREGREFSEAERLLADYRAGIR